MFNNLYTVSFMVCYETISNIIALIQYSYHSNSVIAETCVNIWFLCQNAVQFVAQILNMSWETINVMDALIEWSMLPVK